MRLTGPQAAALAKLTYAIAEGHPLTLLCGPAGVGKTTMLRGLAEAARARGQTVLEFSWSELRGGHSDRHTRCEPMSSTAGNRVDQDTAALTTVVLVDDAHRAVGCELSEFADRWRCHDEGISIVMAGEGRLVSLVGGDTRLERLVRLRVAMPPFTLAETRSLLAASLPAVAAGADAEEVVRTIHEIAGGVPVTAMRLGEMVAILAEAEPRRPLTADDVETIHRRLSLDAA